MTDIRTTAEEFSTSGSLLDIENRTLTDENETNRETYKAIFLLVVLYILKLFYHLNLHLNY